MGVRERLINSAKEKIRNTAENAASAVVDGTLRTVFALVSLLEPTGSLLALYMWWVNRDNKKK